MTQAQALAQKIALPRIPPDSTWPGSLETAACEVFQLMVGVDVHQIPARPYARTESMSAIIGMAGRLCAIFRVLCEQSAALSIGRKMLGEEGPLDLTNARDALGEICNMIAGNFKAKIDGLADGCMLSVPTVVAGNDFQIHMVPNGERIDFCLEYESSPIWMILEIRK
jgi:chemotaxis protein CheX